MNNHYDLVSVAGDVMLRENGEELMLFPEEEFENLFGANYDLDDDEFVETVVNWYYE